MAARTTPSTSALAWARRWAEFTHQMGSSTDPAALRGLRVKRLEMQPGQLLAQVTGRTRVPVQVEIRFPTLTDDQWEQLIAALGTQALFVAQLLAGTMPAEIEQLFVEVGGTLLPCSAVVEQVCTAGDGPVDPAVARLALSVTYAQLGEMVAEDPWLLLRLHGRDRQQVLAAIQERRNSEAQELAARSVAADLEWGSAEPHAFYTPTLSAAHAGTTGDTRLEGHLADFWGRRRVIEAAHHHLALPTVELALLRRLGPPDQTVEGQAAYQQLQEIYHRVTQRAWEMAFSSATEPEDVDSQEG